MTNILVINGSYRDDGFTDQSVETMINELQQAHVKVEQICLREQPIDFCLNCRECAQQPGTEPGTCVLHDEMHKLVEQIEQADGFILASPTNFGSVTAVFKRFMERLIVYAYWPWGNKIPQFRKAKLPKKKAVLISSCAAPGLFGRVFYGTYNQLKITAKTIGADTVGSLFGGFIGRDSHPSLTASQQKKLKKLAQKLV